MVGTVAEQTETNTGAESDDRSTVTLTIPCKAEYVALGRLAVGALGAREGIDEETVADLKVAVTEACACFITRTGVSPTGEAPAILKIDFRVNPAKWVITVSNPDRKARIRMSALCDPPFEGGLGLTIMRALVDLVEESDTDDEGTVFRLVKYIGSDSSAAAQE
jgi:serine/threonine-protein kinase RsbW